MLNASTELRDRLEANTKFFRDQMAGSGFQILKGEHPITPIMLGDAALAAKVADALLEKGVLRCRFFLTQLFLKAKRASVPKSQPHTLVKICLSRLKDSVR